MVIVISIIIIIIIIIEDGGRPPTGHVAPVQERVLLVEVLERRRPARLLHAALGTALGLGLGCVLFDCYCVSLC